MQALGDRDPDRRREAGELLARAYRGPVVALFRWRGGLDEADAEDLAQGFFLAAFEKEWFTRYDPARGRFRTFLRTCADRFGANTALAARREKRGGRQAHVPLDAVIEQADDGDAESEARFRADWVRSILSIAVETLGAEARDRGRLTHLALFEEHDLADEPRPTYAELGRRHGLGDSQVINHLAWARRRLRHHVLDALRTLAGSEAEYREDVRDLLGIDPP